MKERADKVVVSLGLAESRHKAQAMIIAGLVYSGEEKIEKSGQMISLEKEITIKKTNPFVSRGGLKLDSALEKFNIDVKSKVAVDLGVSTGGFTDCLIKRGAAKVFAVDVDTRQIDWRLRNEPRVVLIKKNARFLEKEDFSDDPDIITMDLSFISVLKVLPALKSLLGRGSLVALIKPQFEAGRKQVGKRGIIKDPAVHNSVLEKMIRESGVLGFRTKAINKSSILGQKGNQEFFIHWDLCGEFLSEEQISNLIQEAVGYAKD